MIDKMNENIIKQVEYTIFPNTVAINIKLYMPKYVFLINISICEIQSRIYILIKKKENFNAMNGFIFRQANSIKHNKAINYKEIIIHALNNAFVLKYHVPQDELKILNHIMRNLMFHKIIEIYGL